MDIPYKIRQNILQQIDPLARKLGYTEDQIQDFALFLESIETMLKQADPMEWDKVGTKLENGKCKFPGNFESLLGELIVENEFIRWLSPEKYGGYGYTFLFMVATSQLLSYVDFSLNNMTTISLSVIEALSKNCNDYFEGVIENFMKGKNIGFVAFSEPNAGSNLESVKSSSYLDGDEYVLNGTKLWISNAGFANSGLILTTNMENGKQNGHNVFLVENSKALICERLEKKSGLKASPTAQLRFEDLRVPKEAIVGGSGLGYKMVLERLLSMRVIVAIQGCAASQRAYDLSYKYANTREQFGKSIISFDGVGRKLKAMEVQLPRLNKYCYYAAFVCDRFARGYVPSEVGASGRTSELEAAKLLPAEARAGVTHYYASGAKLYTSEIAQHVVYDAAQIFGGNAFVTENEINKLFRDIRVLSIYDGTSEVHEWVIQKSMKAVEMIPSLKPLIAAYPEETVYEKMLFIRFPKLRGLI